MKKKLMYLAAAAAVACMSAACSSDSNDEPGTSPAAKDIDYTAANANSWHNYMTHVARLLKNDAESLYNAWAVSYNGGEAYAATFRNHNSATYGSAKVCVGEILDGCIDIANEVGTAKIGEPYDLYAAGRREEALYAVESWYSWHSREDYCNNIHSIRNSYLGTLDGSCGAASMSALVKSADPALDAAVTAAIDKAARAIRAIPSPFRNNIDCSEAASAMSACAELDNVIDSRLKPFFDTLEGHDAELDAIVAAYVDNVVLPTYRQLLERNTALLEATQALGANRTDAAFETACAAWLDAREPWEKSEAFLFGPVAALGLDPNMDSWPLDQDAIVSHLTSGHLDDLDWSDTDTDEKIESAQNIRGYHTLEFLLFKDGNPRKTK